MNTQFDAESIINDDDGYRQRLSRSRIHFTPHARLRGSQRNVSEQRSWEVLRNGIRKPSDYHGRWEFSAEGVTVVTDPYVSEVVTTWRAPGHGITLRQVKITPEMAKAHESAMRRLKEKSTWTSHTVAIVDQSGSMREIDMDKLVMRSDLVWLNLAVNVVAKCLQSNERKETDVLSVISMRTESEVVLEYQPFDWVLFNKLADLLHNSAPRGGGCYIPASDIAAEMLGSFRRTPQ